MKSIAYALPRGIQGTEVLASAESEVEGAFGGFTTRQGVVYHCDATGKMLEHASVILEVAYTGSDLAVVVKCGAALAQIVGQDVHGKIDGESVVFSENGRTSIDAAPASASDWPDHFDVGVQTVVGAELHAVQDVFGIHPRSDVRSIESTHYYSGSVRIAGVNETISVVVCCQSSAGNDAAAIIAERMISQWKPKALFLMGIAAGRRGKCKIGDVATPRVVVDDTEAVAEAGRRLRRPRIYAPPHPMVQQLRNFRLPDAIEEWHSVLLQHASVPLPKEGQEKEYDLHVASEPSHHDCGVYSSDTLLRDDELLDREAEQKHQQIRIGEMEAAGFGEACNERGTPIPWTVVRGVSDFGDDLKSDQFHCWAATSAASFLFVLLRHGINVALFERSS